MLAEQVDAKLGAGLGEAEEAVEGEHIGKDARGLCPMGHVEEAAGHGVAGAGEEAVEGAVVKVVNLLVLAVEDGVHRAAAEALGGKHGLDKGAELDEAVVELRGDGPAQLHLVGLEAGVSAGRGARRTHLDSSASRS